MKALTLTQPWATLVVRGDKTVETRDWSYRLPWDVDTGLPRPIRLAIHAAKGQDRDAREFAEHLVRRALLDTADLPRGAILGTVEYFGWRHSYPETRADLAPSPLELELGDWSDGRVLWRFRHPIEFAEPVPYRGALGIWEWPVGVPEMAHLVAQASPR